MNSIMLLIVAACVFALAYRYYSAFIATKIMMLNDQNITPAYRCNDGNEFVPMNKWVLFGHHFAAIAGAGPLVGPVLAAQWGWGPGFMWLLLGSVFAGAVHDFIILFASVRHNGQSLAVIARREVGPIAGVTTSIAILFIIILAMAGLAIVIINALFKNPWGVFTLGLTIPIAIVVGLWMFKISPGSIRSGSIAGFLMVLGSVMLGHWVMPGQIWEGLGPAFSFTQKQLAVILPTYGFFAATLPVWLLLAPRDYLSSYMKIGTIGLLAFGILVVQPAIQFPMTTRFISGGGPIIPGPLWPYVFITIACGAISGFHSLISSGTTPKMFIINTSAAVWAKIAPLFPTKEIAQLSTLVGMDVAHRPGGAVSLAVGMAHVFSSIGGMKHLMSYWYQFAIMFEALFILTTIDAGTRVGRYILQDVLGTYIYAPLKQTSWMPGSIFTSLVVSFSWGYLVYSGDIASIWPMFGVANQLLATIALALGTTIILKIAPVKNYAWVTLAPCIFVAVTTLAAGSMNTSMYFKMGTTLGTINGTASVVLIFLTIIILANCIKQWMQLWQTEKPVGMNTEIKNFCEYGKTQPTITP
ncbi:MAG: cstA [Firmicutes bacterium]|nr:cstA [Bacillota bacterium]